METCKSGSEGGCRKPVVYAIRRLCPTLRCLKTGKKGRGNHDCDHEFPGYTSDRAGGYRNPHIK